jgi:hypothetical protein
MQFRAGLTAGVKFTLRTHPVAKKTGEQQVAVTGLRQPAERKQGTASQAGSFLGAVRAVVGQPAGVRDTRLYDGQARVQVACLGQVLPGEFLNGCHWQMLLSRSNGPAPEVPDGAAAAATAKTVRQVIALTAAATAR